MMRSRVFGVVFFALFLFPLCCAGQNSFVPGESLGTLKLGISEREARKILGYPTKTRLRKTRILWQYQNLPQIDAGTTALSFEKGNLTQIETSNPKVLIQGKPLSECSVADFLRFFPNAKRVFVQVPDAPDPLVYFFDSDNGIGMSFGIGMGPNFGKGATDDLALASVFVFPKGYAPIFPEDPIQEDPTVVVPGVSIGNIWIGLSESELAKLGNMAFEDEQGGYLTLYVGGKLIYLANGKVAQISTDLYSCSVGNNTPLLSSIHAFITQYPDAKIEVRSQGRLSPTAFVYDRAQGIGLSFAIKRDQIVKGFFSKEIVPAYLTGSCLFVFQKGSEPPFLQGPNEYPDTIPSSLADFPLPLTRVPLAPDPRQPYFKDETLSEPTTTFLSLPLFSTTFVGWEVKDAPLNISVNDFLIGLFPGEKIAWKKEGDHAFSFSVETADRLIEAKNHLSLAFEIKENPQRALLYKLHVNHQEVQGTDFIRTITAMTHFALRKRGALPTKVNWN